jgi:hypothetical protein
LLIMLAAPACSPTVSTPSAGAESYQATYEAAPVNAPQAQGTSQNARAVHELKTEEHQQKIAADNEAHRREQEEHSALMRAEMDASRARNEQRGSASESRGASGPAMFSLTLHNSCSKTVKLFFGREPRYGSGTYSSLGGNSVTSYTGRAGDMIWIVDDSQKGVSSISPSGNQNMQITASCSGFGPY